MCVYLVPISTLQKRSTHRQRYQENMFAFQIFESSYHCHINRIEGATGKKCQFEVCMLTDTQHSSMLCTQ